MPSLLRETPTSVRFRSQFERSRMLRPGDLHCSFEAKGGRCFIAAKQVELSTKPFQLRLKIARNGIRLRLRLAEKAHTLFAFPAHPVHVRHRSEVPLSIHRKSHAPILSKRLAHLAKSGFSVFELGDDPSTQKLSKGHKLRWAMLKTQQLSFYGERLNLMGFPTKLMQHRGESQRHRKTMHMT